MAPLWLVLRFPKVVTSQVWSRRAVDLIVVDLTVRAKDFFFQESNVLHCTVTLLPASQGQFLPCCDARTLAMPFNLRPCHVFLLQIEPTSRFLHANSKLLALGFPQSPLVCQALTFIHEKCVLAHAFTLHLYGSTVIAVPAACSALHGLQAELLFTQFIPQGLVIPLQADDCGHTWTFAVSYAHRSY